MNIFNKASVLLVALAMVLTVLPAVSADSDEAVIMPIFRTDPNFTPMDTDPKISCTLEEAGSGSLLTATGWNWVYGGAWRRDPYSAVGLTSGGTFYFGYTPDFTGDIGQTIDKVAIYDYAGIAMTATIRAGLTGAILATAAYTPSSVGWHELDLDTPVTITGNEALVVGVTHAASVYPAACDEGPSNPLGDWISTDGVTWDHLVNLAPTLPYTWLLEVNVGAGGDDDDDDDECLPDQCDFEILGFDDPYNYHGLLNSFPKLIRIWVRNNGEVPISEVKLLADVYEKVCGETSTLWCDEKYDLRFWEDEVVGVWEVGDDGDGDSFVLQGGPDRRWLTNNQAWRNTAGKDRSFGGDEDLYLGLDSGAVGYDTLTWAPVDPDLNDISGALYTKLTFATWCEGEFTFDDDDNLVPIDYGFMEYSLDGGTNWIQLPLTGDDSFIACDTNGEWLEYTVWFLNEGLYEGTYHPGVGAYVCEFQPEEGDIVIAEDYPTEARLQIRFTWVKDPCLQFEGWYIDKFCVERTEKYSEFLIHQTHEILSMEACEEGWLFTFPLGWEPEQDTWYTIKICGQVFSPSGCEIDVENNCIEAQFFVSDILDIACKSLEVISEPPFHSGDNIMVNMTVENLGTLAATDIPVNLKVAPAVASYQHKDYFETDPAGKYDLIWFVGTEMAEVRWSKGDPTISDIYDIDEASARSVLPGSECMVFGEQGVLYPYIVDGTSVGLIPGSYYDFFDYRDAIQATLTFYMKYSFGPGGYSVIMFNQPSMGNSWSGYYLATPSTWSNDWEYVEFDFKDEQANLDYPDEPMRFCIVLFAEGPLASATPNPIPWSGMLLDNFKIYTAFPGTGGVVVDSTIIPGPLAPGAEATVQLQYNDADYCQHSLIGEVKKSGDMNSFNDLCSDVAKVSDFTQIKEFASIDLSEFNEDCLWHLCDTREGGDNTYAWAGVEEGTWGHYVNNMDDSFVSPPINISALAEAPFFGGSLNFSSWWKFADAGDYGETYIRSGPSASWFKIGTVDMTSGPFFVPLSYYIPPEYCTETFQIRFRMKSNSDLVSEGWYIDNVCIVEVTAIEMPPAPGDTWYAFDAYSSGPSNDHSVNFDSDVPGTLYPIGPNTASNFWSAGTWADGQWYISVYGANGLYTVDTSSGALTLVGSMSTYMNGIAYDEVNDIMYGVNSYSLYQIDRFTAATTLLGSTSAYCIDIAFGNGILYGHDFSVDTIVTIDPNTLVVTTLGPTGIAANYAQGMEYDKGNDKLYLAAYTTSGALYEVDLGNGHATLIGAFQNGAEIDAFAIPYAGYIPDVPIAWGDSVWCDDFERAVIAPWTCEKIIAGDFWRHYVDDTGYLPDELTEDCDGDFDWWVVHGYSGTDALNDALYAKIDLTGLTQADISFCTAWNVENPVEMFIEISANWDGTSPMSDAVWVPYWHFPDGIHATSSGGWISSDDLVDDPSNRWNLNQYLGKEVYIRWRYITPGEGFTVKSDHGWAVDNLVLNYKTTTIVKEDKVAPVTSIFFNQLTAQVTLVAYDLPVDGASGVKATYYKIGTGAQQTYTMPFTIPEGTSLITYWSVDNNDNVETAKTVTYTVDTVAPVVTGFTEPQDASLYLFGNFIMKRILGTKTLCIGKVPVAVTATDAGSGVSMVLFTFSDGQTAFDDTPSNGFTTTWRGRNFGDLTITAKARDGKGLESAPKSMTITVYSLGLF